MNNVIRNMLHMAEAINYHELLREGGVIVDVRSTGEYQLGHIRGSINIPLEELPYKLYALNKTGAVIVCCANGFRSSSARAMLEMHGFRSVIDAGPWIELNNEIQ